MSILGALRFNSGTDFGLNNQRLGANLLDKSAQLVSDLERIQQAQGAIDFVRSAPQDTPQKISVKDNPFSVQSFGALPFSDAFDYYNERIEQSIDAIIAIRERLGISLSEGDQREDLHALLDLPESTFDIQA